MRLRSGRTRTPHVKSDNAKMPLTLWQLMENALPVKMVHSLMIPRESAKSIVAKLSRCFNLS
jgi:hypothetical protein